MREHSTKVGEIFQVNADAVQDHLCQMVRSTVEETLNSMLDAEADRLCNAEKYQRTAERLDSCLLFLCG